MTRSGVRVGLAIVVVLSVGAVAGLELTEALVTDESSETQIRKLESFWPSRRRAAATELARFTGEADKVVPTLVKALSDPDTHVRLNAIESLKAFGEKGKAAGPLAKELLLHDEDQTLKQGAAGLLGLIKDEDAVPVLLLALDDRDPAVRIEAIRSLGRFDRRIASAPLVDKVLSALGPDQPTEVRAAAIETLDLLARDQERVARAIAGVAAKDSSAENRYKAVGTIKNPIFEFQVPALIAALDDPSPRVRLIAGGNLARIGMSDDRTAHALCHSVLTADEITREGIGTNLDVLVLDRPTDNTPDELLARRLRKAVREFQTVLETRDAGARDHVINVLGKLIALYQGSAKPGLLEPARDAVAAVLARISDETEVVALRVHALNQWTTIQLARIAVSRRAASQSAPRAQQEELHATSLWITALSGALKSSVPEVRLRAGEILMDHFNDSDTDASVHEAWRKAVPTLTDVTRSEDLKVRNGALAILTLLGPVAREALPSLRSLAAQTPDQAVKSAAEGAIKSIAVIDELNDSDPAKRTSAAVALGRLGWRATPALPTLIAKLEDRESTVRAAAVKSLQTLGPLSATAVPALVKIQADDADAGIRVSILEALEVIAPKTPPTLDAHLRALRDSEPAVRKAAASFKNVPTDDSLVSALGTALGDVDLDVRKTAAASLSKIVFANPLVVPVLLKAFADSRQREVVAEAVDDHLESTSELDDFRRVAARLPELTATLGAMIPPLSKALSRNDEGLRPAVFGLLGRVVAFAGLSRNEELRRAIEPAVSLYLLGLDDSDPVIRATVLARLDSIAIRREEVLAALKKFVERSDRPAEENQAALVAIKKLSEPIDSKNGEASKQAVRFGAPRPKLVD